MRACQNRDLQPGPRGHCDGLSGGVEETVSVCAVGDVLEFGSDEAADAFDGREADEGLVVELFGR